MACCLKSLPIDFVLAILKKMEKALPNPFFEEEVVTQINKAGREIVLVNFLAELPNKNHPFYNKDPVFRILKALLEAKRRGVNISVFLEGSKFESNYQFYKKLKEKGVDVWLDTSKTFIHHKVILTDNKIISGSHNLTFGSIRRNEEFSTLTNNKRIIADFRTELKKLAKQREDIKQNTCKTGLKLPAGFLQGVVREFYGRQAGNAFDLYLFLYKRCKGRRLAIPIDNKVFCNLLGLRPKKAGAGVSASYMRYYYQQRANRILYQLAKGFKLIEIDRDKDVVRCTDISKRCESYSSPKILIPDTFWKRNWHRQLSLRAKYFYLISLAQTKESAYYPWWSLAKTEINKRYHFNEGSIRFAMNELSRYGILEILHSPPIRVGSHYVQEQNYYRLNPLPKQGF